MSVEKIEYCTECDIDHGVVTWCFLCRRRLHAHCVRKTRFNKTTELCSSCWDESEPERKLIEKIRMSTFKEIEEFEQGFYQRMQTKLKNT